MFKFNFRYLKRFYVLYVMQCHLCVQPLTTEEKKSEWPCGCSVHTMCGWRRYMDHYWAGVGLDGGNVVCQNCNTIVFRPTPNPWVAEQAAAADAAVPRVEGLKSQAAFIKDYKQVRANDRVAATAFRQFSAALRIRARIFHGIIHEHITAIRAAKREALLQNKLSNEMIANSRATAKYRASLTRFKNKYGLNASETRLLKLHKARGTIWNSRPAWLIQRKFRIRL